MFWLKTLAVSMLLTWCPGNAIDTRKLQPGRTASPGDEDQPTFDQVVERLNDLSRRYRSLEGELEDAVDKQASMSRSLRIQEGMLNRLQPIIDNFAHYTEIGRRLSSMEERLSERCSCGGLGGGIPTDSPSDREFDGWVERLDRDQIENIRNGFNTVSTSQGRSNAGGSNDVDDSQLGEDSLRALSKVFAGLVSKQIEDDGIQLRPETETKTEPTKQPDTPTQSHQRQTPQQQSSGSNYRPQPQREKTRPGGFPFGRPGRSINRHSRQVSEEELEENLYGLFTELDRAKKRAAFSAIRTMPLFGDSNLAKSISFQKNSANKGKGFDKENGVFTCQVPGLYYFSYTMRSYDGMHIGVALMLNGEPVVAMTTDASERKVMQTQSVMLTLAAGDQVWLLLGPSDKFALYGNDFNYNTFNGVMLG